MTGLLHAERALLEFWRDEATQSLENETALAASSRLILEARGLPNS